METTCVSGHTFIIEPLSRSSVILDLGANAGFFARTVHSRWSCRVHAVEPTPTLAAGLRCIGGLDVHETAVSGCGKDLLFRIDPLNSESSCLVTAFDDQTTVVHGTTLAALIALVGPIDLLKMDVEGAEVDILNMTPDDVLQAIPQLTVEFHDFKTDTAVTKRMVKDVFARMKSLGFEVFVISFWTSGDVLFVNRRHFPMTPATRWNLQLHGRWIPGYKRVLRKLSRGS